MAKKVAIKTTKQEEGANVPSSSAFRFIKDLNGNFNGKEMKYSKGDIAELLPLEVFVYRDWLEKL